MLDGCMLVMLHLSWLSDGKGRIGYLLTACPHHVAQATATHRWACPEFRRLISVTGWDIHLLSLLYFTGQPSCRLTPPANDISISQAHNKLIIS